jgi:23S rRNA pseudouridine2605 synthase
MDKEIKEEINEENTGIRLQVYLSKCGLGSRRKCEELIKKGHVRINQRYITQMGEKVYTDDIVYYRGNRVSPTKKELYLAFYKPSKVLCTNFDPEGRNTINKYFEDFSSYRLFYVGRLDYMSTGLIFLTNDGSFAEKISHPSSEIEKEYVVETSSPIEESILSEMIKGVRVEGELYKIKKYQIKTAVKVHVVLTEGKNREIRKLFTHYRLKVKKLHRVRIGNVKLGNIYPGTYRYLSQKEINWFSKYLGDKN